MLRSRLFWKLFLAFTVLNLLAAAALLLATIDWREDRAYQEAQEGLEAIAPLLERTYGPRLQQGPSTELQQDVRQMGEETSFRITLIRVDGIVIADSSQPDLKSVLGMENHAQRTEVVHAINSGQGANRRTSTTLQAPFFYHACRVEQDGQVLGVVRAALPVAVIKNRARLFRQQISLFGLGVCTALIWVTYLVSRSIVRPVLELNSVAKAISRGDYDQRAFVTNRDELGALAESFNMMSSDLDAQFAELRDSGQRQATVLGGMIEGVIAINQQQHVLLANKAAGGLFELAPHKMEGRPLIEVIRNHALNDAVGESLATGKPQRLDIEWQGAGKLRLSVQVTPLPGKPPSGAVVVLHDTTELHRLETLRQEFVANVSHELKTPLSSIKAYTETLIGGALNDEKHALEFLRRIEEQADRLNALIQDMLSLARIESAQQPFELTSIVISEAVAACLEDYDAMAEARQVELLAESEFPQLEVKADPEGLRVILNNLIDNAIKYTPEGGRVVLRWRPEPDRMVRVEVADTGIGIPQQELPRVFERFHRVDKARSRDRGGTGLGLSIVKHLSQAFGGVAGVESVVDEGSTFWVVLPEG